MKRVKEAARNYFIPRAENNYKPHVLRARTVAFVVVIALVAESAFVFGAKYIIPQSKLFGIIEANALVDETNQNRTANNLQELQISPLLTAAAQDKANDMATLGYFAHTSPQGLTPWYWFQQVGYNFDYAGENLAVNFSDSQDVTTAWMNSPEHRANILSPDFTQIGIATAQGVYEGEPTTFVVEEFGTPAATPVAFVDTASAATIPAAPVSVTPAPAATAPAPVSVPATKPAPVKTAPATPKTTPVPVIVAIQSSSAAGAQQTFIAVQGTATGTAPAAAITSTVPAAVNIPAPAPAPAPTAMIAPQSNFIQQAFSDPRALADDFYFFVMVLFLLALVLNIFINIRVQFPRLIAGGLLVIVVAGLCIMLNQNIGFMHTVVL